MPNSSLKYQREMQPRGEATTQPRLQSDYATKVNAFQNSGLSSFEPYPLLEPSTDLRFPWPVGTPFGRPSNPRGRDYLPADVPGNRAPEYGPSTQRYGALHSAFDRRRRDLIPISGARPAMGLDYGPAPWRVPMIRKTGLGLMAGVCQFASQQFWSGYASTGGGSSGTLLMAPPTWSDYTRGLRGSSGIMARVQGPGRGRVPATFVPRQVR